MRVCIPTSEDKGARSRIDDHFGSAPFFAYADTESAAVEIAPNLGKHHRHGECEPVKHIDATSIDAVVCLGMGKNAWGSLKAQGIEVWVTYADTVADAVEDARSGRLKKLTADGACGGHAHGRRR
jgi:predicted Fe-Mo cluster-binding NifX family protein